MGARRRGEENNQESSPIEDVNPRKLALSMLPLHADDDEHDASHPKPLRMEVHGRWSRCMQWFAYDLYSELP